MCPNWGGGGGSRKSLSTKVLEVSLKGKIKSSYCLWKQWRACIFFWLHEFKISDFNFDYFIPVSIKFDWSCEKKKWGFMWVFSRIFSENFSDAPRLSECFIHSEGNYSRHFMSNQNIDLRPNCWWKGDVLGREGRCSCWQISEIFPKLSHPFKFAVAIISPHYPIQYSFLLKKTLSN